MLAACGQADAPAPAAGHEHMNHAMSGPANHPMVGAIPGNLAPFGDGYPKEGDPCRRLGESAATTRWLDDSATLAGCPTRPDAEKIGGRIVGTVDGVTIVSIPTGDANAGMRTGGRKAAEYGDALVPETDYNATTELRCGMGGAAPTSLCKAGVKRKWGEDGTTLVEVTKPDGTQRALFFKGTKPFGADSSEADGSAAWPFTSTRKGDEVTIKFGPETYIVFDALITGG